MSDFFTGYVEDVLAKTDIGELSAEQKNVYIPQLVALLEERVGLELVPKLNEARMKQFAAMVEQETSPETWGSFWQEALPNFEGEMKRILTAFASQVKGILAETSTQ